MHILKTILNVFLLLLISNCCLFSQEVDILAPGGADFPNNAPEPVKFVENSLYPNLSYYEFTYSGDEEIKYFIYLSYPVSKGLIQVDADIDDKNGLKKYGLKLVHSAGLRFRDSESNIIEPTDFIDNYPVELKSHERVDDNNDGFYDRLILKYEVKIEVIDEDKNEDIVLSYTIEFHLEGKTLVFKIYMTDENGKKLEGYVDGLKNNYCGFSFDQEKQFEPQARIIEIPYAIEWAALYQDCYFSTYLDRKESSASAIGPSDGVGEYKYPAKFIGPITENFYNLKGEIVPVDETGYITISSHIMDVLPMVRNPPSKYRDELSNKIVLNLWDSGTFTSKEFVIARKWIVPDKGKARIYGRAQFFFPSGEDAVKLRIIKVVKKEDGSTAEEILWEKELLSQFNESTDFGFDTDVEKGDEIYFEINSYILSFSNVIYFSPIIKLNDKDVYDSYEGYPPKNDNSPGSWSCMEKIWTDDGKQVYKNLIFDEIYGTYESEHETTNSMGRTWGSPGNARLFHNCTEFLDKLSSYGLKNLAVIFHNWTYFGYDNGLPKHYPPDNYDNYGGEKEFGNLLDAAKKHNYLFAAHENYLISDRTYMNYLNGLNASLDKDSFDKLPCFVQKVGKDKDGNLIPVPEKQMWEKNTISSDWMKWFAALTIDGTKEGSLGLKEAYEKAEFKAGNAAGFLDIITGNNPQATEQINLNPDSYILDPVNSQYLYSSDEFSTLKRSDSFKNVISNTKNFFKFMHDTYDGPLLGEGGYYWGRYDSYYAGYVDGVERQIEEMNYSKLIPDFELKVIRPLMANHGMGYFDRFYPSSISSDAFYNYDFYRATEIAYGHAGFIDSKTRQLVLFPVEHQMLKIKEYYLLQQLQEQYLKTDVKVKDILYHTNSGDLSLDDALKQNIDFYDVQLFIEYDNGLKIYVNRDRKKDWQISDTITLPPGGWYATNQNNDFVGYTARGEKNAVVDYVNSDVYTFADSRSRELQHIGDITTNGMAIINYKRDLDRKDICLLGGTEMVYTSPKEGIISVKSDSSKPCYLTLNYTSENVFELSVDSRCKSYSVDYIDIPKVWFDNEGRLPIEKDGFINIMGEDPKEIDPDIKTSSSPDGKILIFEGLKPLIKYIVTVNPQ